mgnify:CR=1 FL=1
MIWDALNALMAWLCQVIYPLIGYAYKLFYNIGTLRIIKSDGVNKIYDRVTLILGLVMLFVVIFQLIQYIMEPDNFSDKEKGFGKVMVRAVASIVLIAFVPSIFDFAFELQSDIMSNGLIPKIILETEGNYNENWGGEFSSSILEKFYSENASIKNTKCLNGLTANQVVEKNLNVLKGTDDAKFNMQMCINDHERDDEDNERVIQFDAILAVLSGGLVLWMLIMYCLDLGVRVVQLTYLQIIAPIPIIMYMLPKQDGAFEKWVKQCVTTFLDLFLRTAVICFVVLIIDQLKQDDLFSGIISNVSEASQDDKLFRSLLYICLVLGVMTFAKKAGDMLKELFPKGNAASGELGLSTKNRIPEPAKRIAGAGVGLVAAGTLGMARRMYSNSKGALKRDKDFREGLNRNYNDAKSNYESAKAKYNQLRNSTASAADIANAKSNMESYRKTMNEYKGKLRTERAKTAGRVATGLGGGFVAGTLSGANKGMIAGLTTKGGFGGVSKATKSVIKENKALDEWRENGGTSSVSRVMSGISQSIGINPTEVYDKRKEKIEKENTTLNKYSENFKKAKESIESDIEEGKCDGVNTNAKNYRLEQIKAQRLTAQAGNLKLTDFKYKDSQEKDTAKEQIRKMLTTPQQTYVSGDFTSRLEYRKNAKLLEIAEKMWDNDKDKNEKGTKFRNLEGAERESAIAEILNDIADKAYEEVNYESTVEEYTERAREAGNTASDYKKKATQEIGDAIMNGGYKDAEGNVIYKNDKADQLFSIAKAVANAGSSDTDVFTGANLVTFANLKELNDKASGQQNDNTKELIGMENSPEYKAAQANKKYNENGQK